MRIWSPSLNGAAASPVRFGSERFRTTRSIRNPRSTRSVSIASVAYTAFNKYVRLPSFTPSTSGTSLSEQSSQAAEQRFLEMGHLTSATFRGSAVSLPMIDLNASNSHKFSCVESDAEELINASNRSRTCLCFSGVQIFDAIASKASAQIASARVVDVKVNGSKARSLIGA